MKKPIPISTLLQFGNMSFKEMEHCVEFYNCICWCFYFQSSEGLLNTKSHKLTHLSILIFLTESFFLLVMGPMRCVPGVQRQGCEADHSPLTTHHSPLTTHHSPLTTHHSPLTTHHSPRSRKRGCIHSLLHTSYRHSA
jgi:hypothetical protein